ncbi:MAG: OmpH family outer membrane protein [Kiritimatiellae bacterium]|nr:OmpH family outer membrane protein [Kiritimatiellia bacterium]
MKIPFFPALAFAIFASTAASGFAQTASAAPSIATVDMELVVLAHPTTAENKAVLVDLQKRYAAERDSKQEELRVLVAQGRKAAADVRNVALSDAKRREAGATAEDIDEQLRKGEIELRRLVADRQSKLRAKEAELFGNVMADVKVKLDALVAAKGVSLVLDKSATRASAPIPLVMWSADSLDITDELIKATGGDRELAEKALREADAFISGAISASGEAE